MFASIQKNMSIVWKMFFKLAIYIKIMYNINVNFLNPVFRMTCDLI